ncbi:MAG TPA: ribose-5-phosphate isomerase RpiA [Chloroflexota bacterium]|nr:ribose-5-phosphate isomerase RpiA [Chloroflexota bacterium]
MIEGQAGSGDAGASKDSREAFKRIAAERAVEEVRSGMVVGLGAGTTAAFATRRIASLLREGALRDVRGIPSSKAVAALARSLAIPLTSLEEVPEIDLTIDGADEVDPHLNLIKGGGGALLREKIVAQASRREVIVVDAEKLSPALGARWAVPVEVFPFGWRSQEGFLQGLGARVALRRGQAPGAGGAGEGEPFRTDEGNMILDCHFGPLPDPVALEALAAQLDGRAGVAGHGLFLGLASEVFVSGTDGVRRLTPPGPP